jgi:RNA polymerase sigma factor (TIGR02999 family)
MEDRPHKAFTTILEAAGRGDPKAADELLPLLYEQLRQKAVSCMGRLPPGQTLQPTALVHEAFVRLVGRRLDSFENRAHFMFAAGRAMRDILVEQARTKLRRQQLRGDQIVDLDNLTIATMAQPADLLALNGALEVLEKKHAREFEVVLLRFFVGLSAEETAETLGVSLSTVVRDWRFARAWLRDTLEAAEINDEQ